ncbi:hypothetical protein BEP19_02000 [Ammoniphilus oxalaticus]|uniref:Uncharacterized protein n=1 Tax=Ammoniphilus oxalaticus TaxID=66863 RepID=A0A419SN69_9BACL|nr:hypothetical protein [Ammoniphilus oxalaticus]RKD25738.1 hypothetical protein BEP19_02000 [Ammoniphilus oxalaticus]
MSIHREEVVSVLSRYQNGTLLKVIWDNGEKAIYEFETMYDSTNGLEMDDPNYREFHLALFKEYKNPNNFIEVGSGENIPIYIEVLDANEVIWDIQNKC